MFCQLHQLGHLWITHIHTYSTQKHNYQNTLKINMYVYRLTVLNKMQSTANTSNISIYVHLHATEKFTSRKVFWDIFRTNFKTEFVKSQAYIYMTNKLVRITQSCLGAYLYSAGTQYRNLLKLLVMTSMMICHQNIKGHMNTVLKYTNWSHW